MSQSIKMYPKYSSGDLIHSVGEIAIWHLYGVGIVFFTTFWNLVSLNSDKDEIGLDVQVYLKLLCVGLAGLYGVIGFLTDKKIRDAAFSFPLAWILVIFVLYSIASIFSSMPAPAVASSFSILCIYLMTVTAAMELGKDLLVKTIFYGFGAFIFGSWLVYLLIPSIGIMEEPILGGDVAVRMSGLAHPNTLGQHAAFCFIFGVGLWGSYRHRNWVVVLLVALAISALVFSLSRAAMLGTIAAMLIGFRNRIMGPNWKFRLMILTAVSVFGLLLLSTQIHLPTALEKQMGAVAKSGDSDEITTATGRSEIWKKSIVLIKLRPVLGYGPTTSKNLLEDYSMYTHNLFLNIALNCGLFGLLIGIIMCLSRVGTMFSKECFLADAVVAFVLINGIFENVIFANLCGAPTICWVLGLGWYQLGKNEVGDN